MRNNFTNHDRPSGNGHVFLAFKVEAFLDAADFARRMEDQIERLHALPAADGFDAVRYPGERAARIAAERARDGIPLPRHAFDALAALGARF